MKGAQRSTRPSARWALGPLLGLFVAAAVGAVSASGCGENREVFSACPTDGKGNLTVPDECCPCATPEGCQRDYYSKGLTPPPVPEWCCQKGYDVPACWDAGPAAMQVCPGPCVPPAPEGWTGPELVYSGPGFFPPSCPSDAPAIVFEGAAEPVVEPHECPACACDTPVGTCKLPETWTVSSAACAAPGSGIETPFDPPAGWDGICSPCACGVPAGGECIVEAAVTSGNACGGMTWQLNVSSAEPPKCVDLMSGTALTSKQAALWSYQPGACEPSGGAPLVTVKLGVPTTICCQAGP
jgi:hypothetical protein